MKEYATNMLIFAGVTASGLFLVYTLRQYLKRRKYDHIKGPSTKGILGFYIGQLVELNEEYKKGSTFPEEVVKWQQIYGEMFKLQFLNNMLVVITDPVAIKEAIIDENFPKHEFVYNLIGKSFGVRSLGDGLVTLTNTEKWKHKRALFNTGFQRRYLDFWVKEFNDKGDILMEKLRSLADGKTLVVLFKEVNRFALDVISSVAFDLNTGAINDPTVKLNTLISNFMAGLNVLFQDPIITAKPSKRSEVRHYRNVIKELRDFARNHILQRLKEFENKENVPNDILSIIVNNANEQMDLEELVDDFLTFFTAGQETTANSIAFTIMELGLNPHCFQRARAEIDEKIGSKNEISYEDLAKLEYVNCVFKESLRKWPPAGEFSRFCTKDIQLGGIHIPKNTWITFSPFAVARNPKYFPDPEKFEPERFLKGSEIAEKNTFSVGPRSCIGQTFAQLEAKMFLVKFIKNFDFELDPEQSFRALELTTLRPKDGCRIFLKLRQHF